MSPFGATWLTATWPQAPRAAGQRPSEVTTLLSEHLLALASLYVGPRHALSTLLDRGRLIYAGLLALLTAFVLQLTATLMVASLAGLLPVLARRPQRNVESTPPVSAPAPSESARSDSDREVEPSDVTSEVETAPGLAWLAASLAAGPLGTVGALAFLYSPATLLLATLFDRTSSFGVAFRRDYAGLLIGIFSAFTAVFLPLGLLAPVLAAASVPPLWLAALAGTGALAFGALVVLALQVAAGASTRAAIVAVALSWLSLGLSGLVAWLASPLLLYWAYVWLRGDVGDVFGSLGQRQSFRRYLESATLNPRDAGAHYQLGLIHQQRRQYAEARQRFAKAVEIDPSEIDAHFQLGRIARQEERWEDAIRHFEAVLARDPKHALHEAWREAGAVYVSTGAFEHARDVLQRFVDNRPYDPEGLFRFGIALRRLGAEERAREVFSRCVEAARTAPDHRRPEVARWRREAERELRG